MAPKLSISNPPIPITVEPLDPTAFAPFGEVVQNPTTHDGTPDLQSTEANQGTATKWLDVTKMRNWYELSQSRKRAEVAMNMFVCRPRKLVCKNGNQLFPHGVPVKVLERHPFTPQTFVPLGLSKEDRGSCYLVVVAPTLPLKSRKEGEEGALRPAYPVPPLRRKRSLRERLLGARPNPFTNDFSPSTTPAVSDSSAPKPKGPGLPDLGRVRAFVARGDQAITYGAGTWHAPMIVLGEKPVDFVVVQYMNGVAIEDCQEVEIETQPGQDGLVVNVEGFVEPGAARARL